MWSELNKLFTTKTIDYYDIKNLKDGVCPLCNNDTKFYYHPEEWGTTKVTFSVLCDKCCKYFFIETVVTDIYKVSIKETNE
jgi:hypothetical protein